MLDEQSLDSLGVGFLHRRFRVSAGGRRRFRGFLRRHFLVSKQLEGRLLQGQGNNGEDDYSKEVNEGFCPSRTFIKP